jgi:hypothetical protein
MLSDIIFWNYYINGDDAVTYFHSEESYCEAASLREKAFVSLRKHNSKAY